ncbi:MAG: TetR/AcrR family transcriptional regulator [Clostridia bacterium]|nr:TetR/AcrR family transcriptional regulator [Clostridia bacterium]
MRNKEEPKEAIINATIKLIEQSDGNMHTITARAIADKSEVALGLINYHFESKENLIAICIQRIINKILMNFAPDKIDYTKDDGLTDKERLISFAQQTYDFLFDNYSIIKISILSDFKDYKSKCNSVYTQMGFRFALRSNISESKKQLIAFSLISIMQNAFLCGENSKAITGYNLTDKTERDLFISDTVSMLMEGFYEE